MDENPYQAPLERSSALELPDWIRGLRIEHRTGSTRSQTGLATWLFLAAISTLFDALLLPPINAVRTVLRQAHCTNALKQVAPRKPTTSASKSMVARSTPAKVVSSSVRRRAGPAGAARLAKFMRNHGARGVAKFLVASYREKARDVAAFIAASAALLLAAVTLPPRIGGGSFRKTCSDPPAFHLMSWGASLEENRKSPRFTATR